MFLSIYKTSFLHNLVNKNENSIAIYTNFFLYIYPLLENKTSPGHSPKLNVNSDSIISDEGVSVVTQDDHMFPSGAL